MAAPTRKQRLESLLHREIATIVQRELRDPRIGFLTITRVEMSPDLHLVTAYFTIFGDAKQRRLAEKAMQDAVPYVQRAYAPVVRTRLLPQLSFKYDDQEAKRSELDELIRKARASDPDPTGGERPDPRAP